MATPQQPMPPGAGPRPQAGQGPPPAMVLHGQHPSLVPMIPTPAHFAAQQGAYPTQIPLQHQRPMMNGFPAGAHPNFPAVQHNPSTAMAAQAHMRQLQQPSGPMGPVGQAAFPPQMQPTMHPQQIEQIQRFQQQNPGVRVMPLQHLIPQQPVAGPNMQHMAATQQLMSRGNLPLQRFALFAWQLSGPSPAKTKEAYWHKFVQEWFVQTATLRVVLAEGQQGRKEFELPSSLIHHFFHSIHSSGVRQMNLMLGAPQVESGPHIFECPGASILYRFDNGAQVLWEGSIRVQFKGAGQELKIERLEIVNDEYTEFVPRKIAKQQLTPPLSNRSTSPDAKRSPMERNTLSQMSGDVRGGSDHGEISLPRTDINEMGVPAHLMRFLEVAEIFVYLRPLIDFSRTKEVSPDQALKTYPYSHHPSNQFQHPNAFMHPSQVSQMASPMNDMSPLAGHTSLPITGITSSPQPHHYPSPMSSQTSQTGATGPNTTPLMSQRPAPSSAPKAPQGNKRRRGSAVQNMSMKEEDEDLGSKHPKQSPRIGTGRGGAPAGPPGKRLRSDG